MSAMLKISSFVKYLVYIQRGHKRESNWLLRHWITMGAYNIVTVTSVVSLATKFIHKQKNIRI